MVRRSTLLTVVVVVLVLLGLTLFVLGAYLAAGVAMLATSFAIYLRETRT